MKLINELMSLTEGKVRLTKEERIFQNACLEAAAKLLGVPKARCIWYDDGALWKKLNDLDEGADLPTSDKTASVSVIDLFDNPKVLDDSGEEDLTLLTIDGKTFVRGEFNDYGGGDDPHYFIPADVKDL